MRIALAQRFIHVLSIFLLSIMLSACAIDSPALAKVPPADPADPPALSHVAPFNTAAGNLRLTVNIRDDQDALDKTIHIDMNFSTSLLRNQNTVQFGGGETSSCNGVKLGYNNDPNDTYSATILANDSYRCTYSSSYGGSAIIMDAQPRLNPRLISSGKGFILTYNTNRDSQHCQIQVTTAQGPSGTPSLWVGDTGSYTNSDVSGLSGNGEVVLERRCTYKKPDGFYQGSAFRNITVTYDTRASLQVTWR
jgi:hypothetical protein